MTNDDSEPGCARCFRDIIPSCRLASSSQLRSLSKDRFFHLGVAPRPPAMEVEGSRFLRLFVNVAARADDEDIKCALGRFGQLGWDRTEDGSI